MSQIPATMSKGKEAKDAKVPTVKPKFLLHNGLRIDLEVDRIVLSAAETGGRDSDIMSYFPVKYHIGKVR